MSWKVHHTHHGTVVLVYEISDNNKFNLRSQLSPDEARAIAKKLNERADLIEKGEHRLAERCLEIREN